MQACRRCTRSCHRCRRGQLPAMRLALSRMPPRLAVCAAAHLARCRALQNKHCAGVREHTLHGFLEAHGFLAAHRARCRVLRNKHCAGAREHTLLGALRGASSALGDVPRMPSLRSMPKVSCSAVCCVGSQNAAAFFCVGSQNASAVCEVLWPRAESVRCIPAFQHCASHMSESSKPHPGLSSG